MKYTEEEILEFAKSHIRNIDQQKGKRLVIGFVGLSGVVTVSLLITELLKKSDKMGGGLFTDEKFILGLVLGFFATFIFSISVLGFLRMLSIFYGKDIEVYRLLLRWSDEKVSIE